MFLGLPHYRGKLSPASGQLKRYKACLKPWREHVLEHGIKYRSLKPHCKGQRIEEPLPCDGQYLFQPHTDLSLLFGP